MCNVQVVVFPSLHYLLTCAGCTSSPSTRTKSDSSTTDCTQHFSNDHSSRLRRAAFLMVGREFQISSFSCGEKHLRLGMLCTVGGPKWTRRVRRRFGGGDDSDASSSEEYQQSSSSSSSEDDTRGSCRTGGTHMRGFARKRPSGRLREQLGAAVMMDSGLRRSSVDAGDFMA